ncbi:MAG: hypothetical protein JW862_01125, partial [Anaerolineales bacterium]|nr:hypothetical protein [Anaerolineales bacterium]
MSQNKPEITFYPIGRVLNEFDENSSREAMKSGLSRIVLDTELTQGLEGLEPGQGLLVLYHFDRSEGYD